MLGNNLDFVITVFSGDSLQSLRNQLHDLAREGPVCRVLDGVAEEDIETFYSSYVDDFVKMVHKCNHKKSQYTNLEYKVQLRERDKGISHGNACR